MWNNTFKTAPSAGVQAYEDSLPNIDRIGPILGSVLKALTKESGASMLPTHAIDFTLVNLYHAPTNDSVGYLGVPPVFSGQDTGLVFTFALTSIDRKKFKWPSDAQATRGRGLMLWGNGKHKFCSVVISRTELAKNQSTALLTPMLRTIYNIVGAASKNLMRFGTELVVDLDPQYFHIFERRSKAASNLTLLLDSVRYSEWVLCYYFWRDHSYLLDVNGDTLPPNFALYWTLCLDDTVYRLGMYRGARDKVESILSSYWAAGYALLKSVVASNALPTKLPPELVAFIVKVRSLNGDPINETSYAEYEHAVLVYLSKLAANCADNTVLGEGLRDALEAQTGSGFAAAMVSGITSAQRVRTVLQLIEAAAIARS